MSGKNSEVAKRKVAAAAMKQIFDISLPVYEPLTDDMFYKKYQQYFNYNIVGFGPQPWKATFTVRFVLSLTNH